MSEPKLHHWWPRFHQCNWVDKRGRVHAIWKDRVYAVNPVKNAAIQDDNTLILEDGTKTREVEKWFGEKVEGPAAVALKRLVGFRNSVSQACPIPTGADRNCIVRSGKVSVRTVDISEKEKAALSLYIASLVVRIPSYREQISEVFEMLRERALAERGVNIPKPSKSATRNNQIQWMLKHLDDFGAVIAQSAWIAFEDPGRRFLFGDTPVIPYRERDGRASFVVPILPDLALSFMGDPRGTGFSNLKIIECSEKLVDAYNEKTICQAREKVFASASPTSKVLALVSSKLGSFRTIIGDPSEEFVENFLDGQHPESEPRNH